MLKIIIKSFSISICLLFSMHASEKKTIRLMSWNFQTTFLAKSKESIQSSQTSKQTIEHNERLKELEKNIAAKTTTIDQLTSIIETAPATKDMTQEKDARIVHEKERASLEQEKAQLMKTLKAQDERTQKAIDVTTIGSSILQKISPNLVKPSAVSDRLSIAVELIKKYDPDIICFQETHLFDIEQFIKQLPHFSWIGESANKEVTNLEKLFKSSGDINPIVYKSSLMDLVHKQTIWLNENNTPHQAPATWGGSIRMCTNGTFSLRGSGQKLAVFNLHLDNVFGQARANGLHSLAPFYQEQTKNNSLPGILAGDFNMNTNDPELLAIMGNPPFNVKDSKQIAIQKIVQKENVSLDVATPNIQEVTYVGFYKYYLTEPDHIFVNDKVKVEKYEVIKYKQEAIGPDEHSPSDHLAIIVDLEIK